CCWFTSSAGTGSRATRAAMATSPIRRPSCQAREQGRPPFLAAHSIRPFGPQLLLAALNSRLGGLHLAYLVAIAGALLPFLNWGRGYSQEIHCSGLLPRDFPEDSHWKCRSFGLVTF